LVYGRGGGGSLERVSDVITAQEIRTAAAIQDRGFLFLHEIERITKMIVNMSDNATPEQIEHIIQRIREAGFQPHVTRGTERTIVAAVGSGGRRHEIEALCVAPGVDNVVPIAQPFKLVSRQTRPSPSVVEVAGVRIGGNEVVVIAGPCSVESRQQMLETAHAVNRAGASMLRGGAYKPRTSPYEFQGLGIEALKILREAGVIDDCHELHYLQMALEKIARSYLLKSTRGDRRAYLLSHVP
jgi:hypothetical protein